MVVAASSAVLMSGVGLQADDSSAPPGASAATAPVSGTPKVGGLKKLSGELRDLVQSDAGGRVLIDAVAAGNPPALIADIEALGGRIETSYGQVVGAQVYVATLAALAGSENLAFARIPSVKTRVGAANSEGDEAIRAREARTDFGVPGRGIVVGVVSDSFDCLGTAADDRASKDLPPNPRGVLVLDDRLCRKDGGPTKGVR